eukprot:scaffold2773_cov410-Prasinococcus_capsulatus_cf.AAC.19
MLPRLGLWGHSESEGEEVDVFEQLKQNILTEVAQTAKLGREALSRPPVALVGSPVSVATRLSLQQLILTVGQGRTLTHTSGPCRPIQRTERAPLAAEKAGGLEAAPSGCAVGGMCRGSVRRRTSKRSISSQRATGKDW